MDYQAIYHRLIDRARNRQLSGYKEKHHIIPRCIGGSDDPSNIAILTPEEHYVAHLLLVKIHPTDHRLLWAAVAMTNGTQNNPRKNKLYGWLRRRFSAMLTERNRGRVVSEETRSKMSAARKGKKGQPHSEATKAKMRAAAKGRPKSDAHRYALAQAKLGKKFKPRSEAAKENMRQAQHRAAQDRDESYKQDAAYQQRQAKRMREIWKARKAGRLPLPNHTKVKEN